MADPIPLEAPGDSTSARGAQWEVYQGVTSVTQAPRESGEEGEGGRARRRGKDVGSSPVTTAVFPTRDCEAGILAIIRRGDEGGKRWK